MHELPYMLVNYYIIQYAYITSWLRAWLDIWCKCLFCYMDLKYITHIKMIECCNKIHGKWIAKNKRGEMTASSQLDTQLLLFLVSCFSALFTCPSGFFFILQKATAVFLFSLVIHTWSYISIYLQCGLWFLAATFWMWTSDVNNLKLGIFN